MAVLWSWLTATGRQEEKGRRAAAGLGRQRHLHKAQQSGQREWLGSVPKSCCKKMRGWGDGGCRKQ